MEVVLRLTSLIRRLCRALRPSILDDLGLLPAIEALTGEVRSRSKLDVSIEVEGTPVRLPAEPELAIYRVVQEALHNVERPASATRVSVELNYDQSGTRVSIVDDGRGFDPKQAAQTDRLGLVGMRERARLVASSRYPDPKASPESSSGYPTLANAVKDLDPGAAPRAQGPYRRCRHRTAPSTTLRCRRRT